MDITKLKIDVTEMSNKAIVVGVKPTYNYIDGRKVSDEVVAFRYECVFPNLEYEKLNVTVDVNGEQINVKDRPVEVSLNNLNAEIYWTPNGYNIRATASGVHAVNKSDKH